MLTYLGKLSHPLGAWLCIRTDGLACPPTPSPTPTEEKAVPVPHHPVPENAVMVRRICMRV